MVISFIKGRIRLRLAELKGSTAPKLPNLNVKGLKNVAINPLTGSVLIDYDPEVLQAETIASILEPFAPQDAHTLRNPELLKPKPILSAWSAPKNARPSRPGHGSAEATSEVINLGITFLTCLATGFFKYKKAHVQSGILFGALLAGHVFKYRKRLRPLKEMSFREILGLDFWPSLGPSNCSQGEPIDDYRSIEQDLSEDAQNAEVAKEENFKN
jgi:hypothetical protein